MAPRFFVAQPLDPSFAGREIVLAEPVAHHALRVLRLSQGDAIVLFDGRGGEYHATLSSSDKRAARARIERFDGVEREWPHGVVLVQSVIAADPMESTVRKAVELGVTAIEPVLAARSQGGAGPDRRLDRWRAVAVAACEQCGRNRVPSVEAPIPLGRWLRERAPTIGHAVALAPEASASLASLAERRWPDALLIGPEGGWTPDEIRAMSGLGIECAQLGPAILRADTAAVAALATVRARCGR